MSGGRGSPPGPEPDVILRGEEPDDEQEDDRELVEVETWVGPIPPPGLLVKYERLSPGLAERIVSMAETEGEHRRGLENRELDGQIRIVRRGQIERLVGQVFGFLIGMTAIVGGVFLASTGHDVAGSLLSIGAVAGLVGVFVHGRRSDRGGAPDDQGGEPEE